MDLEVALLILGHLFDSFLNFRCLFYILAALLLMHLRLLSNLDQVLRPRQLLEALTWEGYLYAG